jgi:hypothetical protein
MAKTKGGDGHPWPWAPSGDGDPIPWAKLLGDEDPFPLRLKSGAIVGKWTAGRGEYHAFQVGPIVELVASGKTSDFNTRVKLVQTPLRIFPPQYILLFLVPEITLPTEMPFTVPASFLSEEPIKTIVVWDADGKHQVPVIHSPL